MVPQFNRSGRGAQESAFSKADQFLQAKTNAGGPVSVVVENGDLYARPSDSFTLQLAVVDLSCGSSTETYMLSPR